MPVRDFTGDRLYLHVVIGSLWRGLIEDLRPHISSDLPTNIKWGIIFFVTGLMNL